jgi:hypothetical protein|tara:strand:+ start:495 stop:1367 length:873 start_codon:yes stop_codon:yes gene_type:complete
MHDKRIAHKKISQHIDFDESVKPIWKNESPINTEKKIVEPEYSIMVCTPVHSEVSIHYAQSLLEMQKFCFANNIKIAFHLIKSSLVTQGRNLCVAAFLNEPRATHLLFIDSDIDFEPSTIYEMLKKDVDVLSVPYPLKTINWDKGYDYIKNDRIKSARDLQMSLNNYPMKLKDIDNVLVKDGIMEVTHSPTGCMLIKRSVLEKMVKEYPHMLIKQSTIINGKQVETKNLYNFFDTLFDPETNTYHGEDFAFCRRWADIGGQCHAYINDHISHIGEHQYTGRFADELKRID